MLLEKITRDTKAESLVGKILTKDGREVQLHEVKENVFFVTYDYMSWASRWGILTLNEIIDQDYQIYVDYDDQFDWMNGDNLTVDDDATTLKEDGGWDAY